MKQWLYRGYEISPEERVRNLCLSEKEWQIYSTNRDAYVLVVSNALHSFWEEKGILPEGLFEKREEQIQIWLFTTKPDYLIASLKYGPFPNEERQVEAFAYAFEAARKKGIILEEAIYIEEYSLLLPTKEEGGKDSIAFGKWVTGGLGVPIDAFDQVAKVMSWLPKEKLQKFAKLAGFDVEETEKEAERVIGDPLITQSGAVIPAEPFRLSGRKELETFLNENIIDVLRNPEEYKKMGVESAGAVVLYGPPGSGKTYAIDRLSEYLGWERFDIDSSSIASPYIHETGKKIAEVFNMAMEAAPSILVIDEMEAYLTDREGQQTHGVEEVAEFLRKIPEAVSKGVLIFAMTNVLEIIDKAIIRKGRFDYILKIGMAEKEEILEVLEEKTKNLPIDETVELDAISEKLSGHPLSDVAFILREAGKITIKRKRDTIDNESFEMAFKLLSNNEECEERKIGF